MKNIHVRQSCRRIDQRILKEESDPDYPAVTLQLLKNWNYQIGVTRAAWSASYCSKNIESGSTIGRRVGGPVDEALAHRVWSLTVADVLPAAAVKSRTRAGTGKTIRNPDYSSSINSNLIVYYRYCLCAHCPCETRNKQSYDKRPNTFLHSFLSFTCSCATTGIRTVFTVAAP